MAFRTTKRNTVALFVQRQTWFLPKLRRLLSFSFQTRKGICSPPEGGGGGNTSNGLYGEDPLRAYEMVGISLVLLEVQEGIGKSFIRVFNKAQKGLKDTNYGCEVEKKFWFCDLFIFQRQCIYSKGCKALSYNPGQNYLRKFSHHVHFPTQQNYFPNDAFAERNPLPPIQCCFLETPRDQAFF